MDQLANALNELVTLAHNDLDAFWREMGEITTAAAAGDQQARQMVESAMHEVLPGLISTYQDTAVAIAADAYDNQRADLGITDRLGDGFRAGGVELPDGGNALAGWVANTAETTQGFIGLVGGGVQRRIMNAGRHTIMDAAISDPASRGWMRQGRGSTCPFCRGLIHRDDVYSERTADFAAHDHCNCIAVSAFTGEKRPAKTYTPSDRFATPEARAAHNERTLAAIESGGFAGGGGKVPPVARGGGSDDPDWNDNERAIVEYLRGVGHHVDPGGKSAGGERLFDAMVDGRATEFKTPDPGGDSGTMRNRAADSKRRGGQARDLIFDLRAAGTSEDEAKRGIARIRGAYSKYFDRIRAIGDTFDITEEF